jgi:meiotically up-regulated gene 157 (Mug157) protein/transglutaminase-like putative cysteine protease
VTIQHFMHLSKNSFRRSATASVFGATLISFSAGVVMAAPSSPQTRIPQITTQLKPTPDARWWPQSTEEVLVLAEGNRAQLSQALQKVPKAQRVGMQFLIENMPLEDSRSLSSKFLLDHVALAYEGLAASPWKERISQEMFLNNILPYSSLNEVRDESYQFLKDKVRPLVGTCKTPSEAAQTLNRQIFPLFNVKYSTARKKPDQSPLESMQSGLATCSGLSILLVDACRVVGVPARVVGTPMWSNGRGNHTWVEIWDGDWKFLGAAEPDEQGLNHGWFVGDAAQAKADVRENAIYATSFKNTGINFPMVWAPESKLVNAINVTARYAPAAPPQSDKTRVLLKVVGPDGKRIKAPVVVVDAITQAELLRGNSKDESFDTNDFLSVELPHGSRFVAKLAIDNAPLQSFETGTGAEQLVVLTQAVPVTMAAPATAPKTPLQNALADYFAATPAQQSQWKFAADFEKMLRRDEAMVRKAVWEAYKAAPIHAEAKADIEAKQVRFNEYTSPYLVKTVGTRPVSGWGLVIAMHGGGNTAKEVNDSQWQGMFRHYKEHPELGGYVYIALRAPNDTWNGFYDDYVYPLVANLIKEYTLFGDVDPNRVYIMGYSHGGYGAYAIGPKMPDRFAAIHASAGAATDGETAAKNLRNTQFTAMVGELDTAYDRLSRNQKFDAELRTLRGNRTDIFPGHIDVIPNTQHGALKDYDMLTEMLPVKRNPVPRELTWLMTDKVITDFFWLHTDTPGKNKEIDASIRDNQIVIRTTGAPEATIYLDNRLIDFSKSVAVEINGVKAQMRPSPSLNVLCETMLRRGDPDLAFTAKIDLQKAAPAKNVAPQADTKINTQTKISTPKISTLVEAKFTQTMNEPKFPVVRADANKRHFQSEAIEKAITQFQAHVTDPELGWLFENCFPNTLDTTVTTETKNGRPSTYVITGDIDAMWLRDSSAQVWPYLKFVEKDASLRSLIAGVINKQTECVLLDPYANAFYKDATETGHWKSDNTTMKDGIHERKWEIDSLCYPIRLAYNYWKTTDDVAPFDSKWQEAIKLTLKTFREQQRKTDRGPYRFQRNTSQPTDSLPMSGYGFPVKPVGLICSSFRPSDDATTFSFLVPSNFFAVVSLREAAEMMEKISNDKKMAQELRALADEVETALKKYAVIDVPKYGKVYAFEVNGFGSFSLMDDANIPSLLSLPYLGAVSVKDPIYRNTRKMVLSEDNPFFFKGKVAEGIGGPHVGQDMIWPMAIIMRALTSTDDKEIATCIQQLKTSHAGTGFMHETFNKDNASNFSRSWFAWANTLFGELMWKTYEEKPTLLVSK